MKIRSATIDNCKSYKDPESFTLEDDISLLVGPNAGGKSNAMDILAVVLRRFFLQTYTINEGQDTGIPFQDILQPNQFHPIYKFLDKNAERETDALQIKVVLEVGSTDVDNVRTILEHVCSRNTATNDLRKLIQKRIIRESGRKGAGAFYVIAQ